MNQLHLDISQFFELFLFFRLFFLERCQLFDFVLFDMSLPGLVKPKLVQFGLFFLIMNLESSFLLELMLLSSTLINRLLSTFRFLLNLNILHFLFFLDLIDNFR